MTDCANASETARPTPDLEATFELIRRERGEVSEIYRAFSDFPEGVRAHFEFYRTLMLREHLPLDRAEREWLAVETSRRNQCPYCIAHHEEALKNTADGVVEKKKRKALSELAEILTQEPWKANWQMPKFLGAGFSPAQWQHAVMVVSYFNFANRCVHAMGLEIESSYEVTCN